MKKRMMVAGLMLTLSIMLTSCAALSDWYKTTKGSLIGNAYTIYQYDNSGNQTLELDGNSIEISPYEPTSDSEGNQVLNSVLDITIDGSQILAVGNTLIFEEVGISKMMGFEEIKDFEKQQQGLGLHYIPFDKMMNDIKNQMGKQRVVLVYSQLGEPIGVYQGDDVLVTVPDNLPKMTRINIDGKSLYLHRVNYTIVDTKLMK